MAIKDNVLKALEENRGRDLSGAQLAGELGVSRSAVWKAVKVLKEEGHEIMAVTNRGYCLSEQSPVLSPQSIQKYLRQNSFKAIPDIAEFLDIHVFPTVSSTNTVCTQFAHEGAPEGTVILAEEQTAGKGRLGRTFFSPKFSGLYMSILLHPVIPANDALLITTAAAVAASRAIEKVLDTQISIKWVNDLYQNGKKVCGILTEAAFDMESRRLSHAVLGIGLNIHEPEGGFPLQISQATALTSYSSASSAAADLRSRLAAQILLEFFMIYPNLSEKAFMEEYRRRSFLVGTEVEIQMEGSLKTVKVLYVDDDARLAVRLKDGTTKLLSSGEVTLHKEK